MQTKFNWAAHNGVIIFVKLSLMLCKSCRLLHTTPFLSLLTHPCQHLLPRDHTTALLTHHALCILPALGLCSIYTLSTMCSISFPFPTLSSVPACKAPFQWHQTIRNLPFWTCTVLYRYCCSKIYHVLHLFVWTKKVGTLWRMMVSSSNGSSWGHDIIWKKEGRDGRMGENECLCLLLGQ